MGLQGDDAIRNKTAFSPSRSERRRTAWKEREGGIPNRQEAGSGSGDAPSGLGGQLAALVKEHHVIAHDDHVYTDGSQVGGVFRCRWDTGSHHLDAAGVTFFDQLVQARRNFGI